MNPILFVLFCVNIYLIPKNVMVGSFETSSTCQTLLSDLWIKFIQFVGSCITLDFQSSSVRYALLANDQFLCFDIHLFTAVGFVGNCTFQSTTVKQRQQDILPEIILRFDSTELLHLDSTAGFFAKKQKGCDLFHIKFYCDFTTNFTPCDCDR